MSKTESIRARVEPDLKEDAEAVFEELGLTPTEAITLFYRQVKLHNGLPFELRIPNAQTRKAMRDVLKGKGVKRWSSVDALKKAYR